MQKEELLEQLGETYGYVQHLVEKKVDYFKLEMAEKTATTVSGLITALILGTVGLLTLLFALVALAFYLATLLDSTALGFGMVALILLALLMLLVLLRRTLITDPTVSGVIASFFDNNGKNV